MNKQEAWDEWVRVKVDGYPTDIERSSHGRAFSAGWDASGKQIRRLRKLLQRAADAIPNYTTGRTDKLLDAIDKELE